MDESVRLKKSWARIEYWLKENFPESLDKLHPAAPKARITSIEKTIGIPFPPALFTLLSIHNGEKNIWPPGIFPDGQRFLPVDEILDMWSKLKAGGGEASNPKTQANQWCAWVNNKTPLIDGPIKPLRASERWIPICASGCKTMYFLDYDPPQGGTRGQVIAANPERGIYRVLAPSFIRYMETYAMDLAVNKYTVQGDHIVVPKPAHPEILPANSVLSDEKMAGSQKQNPVKPSSHCRPANWESSEEVVIAGQMTSLMGEDEILFSVQTERGREYTFLAKPVFTQGYGKIAIDQFAQVKARKFYGEIKSHFIDQGLAKRPDYSALEYCILRAPQTPAKHDGLLSGARTHTIEKLAQNILDSIQVNYRNHHNYQELTPDNLDPLRAKFYHHYTTRLLKLDFAYVCDLEDPARRHMKTSAQFRVMASDDGVVASFYHLKPKLSAYLMRWRNNILPKVIQFETEFSDGHIIISTTAQEKSDHPLPDAITQHLHYADISVEGLLHKHRMKIKRYQIRHPGVSVKQVNKTDEFFALRNRQHQLMFDHIRSIGWVTKEYLFKQIKNQKIANQVYDKIQRMARN
ncbi:SMI1/KNR4 family protein [Kaarinaea lacus]